jgi:hypothetical protein
MSVNQKVLASLIRTVMIDDTPETRIAIALVVAQVAKSVNNDDPALLFTNKILGSSKYDVKVVYNRLCRTAFHAFAYKDPAKALLLAMSMSDNPAGFHDNPDFDDLFVKELFDTMLKV